MRKRPVPGQPSLFRTEAVEKDERYRPLCEFMTRTFLEQTGIPLLMDKADYSLTHRTLAGTKTLSLEVWEDGWLRFLVDWAKDAWLHRQQPVRYFMTHYTAWLRPAAVYRAPQPELVAATEAECKLWAQACANIVSQIGAHSYEQWIRPLVLVRFGERVVVRAPNRTFGRWVEQLHGAALRAAVGREVEVQ